MLALPFLLHPSKGIGRGLQGVFFRCSPPRIFRALHVQTRGGVERFSLRDFLLRPLFPPRGPTQSAAFEERHRSTLKMNLSRFQFQQLSAQSISFRLFYYYPATRILMFKTVILHASGRAMAGFPSIEPALSALFPWPVHQR